MEPTQSEQNNAIYQKNTPPDKTSGSFVKGLGDFTTFACIVIVIVVGIRFFVAQPFIVSGASMVPNFASNDYLIVDEISYRLKEPARGDVVVFHPPVDMKTYYIKRIIGMPGDHISIVNGVVTITNTEHPNGVVLKEDYITPDTLSENKSSDVPEGQYYVMGDNRPESFDSRGWGLLPRANVTGRAFARLFPAQKFALFPAEHKLIAQDGSEI